MTLSKHQQHFVDKTIFIAKVKQAISSKYEFEFKKILNALGEEGKDWFHQHPFCDEANGIIAVADFTFVREKLIIELDGEEHKYKKESDKKRDLVFACNDFYVLRINTPIKKGRETFWKVYIENILTMLREKPENKKKKSKTCMTIKNEKEFLTSYRNKIKNL